MNDSGLAVRRAGLAGQRPVAGAAPDGGVIRLGELELGLGLFFSAFALIAARAYPLWRDHYYVACPLLEWTGLPCVTCGGTRALAALAAGQGWAAFAWNPAVALAGVGALLFLPLGVYWLASPERRPTVPNRLPLPVTLAGALLLAANQVYLWIWFPVTG